MVSVKKTIEVNAPIDAVYNQWTQFESFPRFMKNVVEVHQLDDTRVRWRARVWGKEHEWVAKIVEQVPEERISWRSEAGDENGGTVLFEALEKNKTRITLLIDREAEGALEKAGQGLGILDKEVKADLDNFKKFIEERGREEGAWRGEIHGGVVGGRSR